MPVSLIQDLQQLNPHLDTWQRFAAQPMMSPDWLLTWWRHYGVRDDHQLFVLAVHDAHEQLIGLAPWYLRHHRVLGSAIHALGDGEACSDRVSLICQPGRRREMAQSLSAWLMSTAGTEHARLVQLNNVDADDPTLNLLAAACADRGAWIERRMSPSNWQLDLPASWEDYLASLSRNHRKRCRRWDRTFFQSGRVQVHAAESPKDLASGLEILADLHSSRRKSLGGQGVFDGARFRSFHADVMQQMFAANRLRLSWLVMDHRPIAIEYQLVSRDCVYAYQSGMDASDAQIGPGNLSVMASIRWAIENGKRRFDFMRGDEAYKSSWGATRDCAYHLRIRPSQWADTVRHRASRVGYQTRSWLRRRRQSVRATLQQVRRAGPRRPAVSSPVRAG